jgi:hypothetical protein
MYAFVFELDNSWVVRIGVTDPTLAYSFHDTTILSPVLGPILHMMVGRLMNSAKLTRTLIGIVNIH